MGCNLHDVRDATGLGRRADGSRSVRHRTWLICRGVRLGMAEPPIMSIAMASQERDLGATAALLGAGTYVLGALATPVAGAQAQDGAHAWLGFLLAVALVALVLTFFSVRSIGRKAITTH